MGGIESAETEQRVQQLEQNVFFQVTGQREVRAKGENKAPTAFTAIFIFSIYYT